MVSITLLHRGVFYFTVMGTNVLPLLKHGMDLYFLQYRGGTGTGCQRQVLPLVCFDDLGQDWTIYTELGCASVIAMLAMVIVGLDTIIAFYFFLFSCHGKKEDFLAGAEDGCCGLAAVVLSFGHYDNEVLAKSKSMAAKWRRASRFVTAVIQIVMIVAAASALRVVTNIDSRPEQKSSTFVLLPCLLLNITSWIENMYDGIMVLYGD
ncbi:hypothetical protein BATDEDRAFT_88513 [Batrachochytrium dendrobatidis JAM81]|uniref:Uncharacterized protein n=2 Tax=Batrachochytrium dendrobatidis TaxID=109871 RepID=F4P376_BATDJ|nr:uncharacterized protein BATDEDRAFT_88513 [Batrachochytrium dendrobatidis JAM81]EGF80350.1 hypothetical protein BATDEDRAFT_88513 [Batrachochytrium dendrobatidis JAM81]KAK5666537.1 hypothetical protein QVD99_006610 [Batrachochytrium dendrobatidis]OAJ41330.1 hypothetical protein BDEG_24950 [Batrachochytrium dendrobatidis JEL423]|eukprot:XP_006679255.1 hypothetical protein BATDEDRAFT_88513 [Batrachochytrium dendrobatidis JAM81]